MNVEYVVSLLGISAFVIKKGTHHSAHPLLDLVNRQRLRCGHHIDATTFAIEFYFTIDQREQRVVFALADAFARMKLVAHLADEDVAGDDFFATVLFYAPILSVGIATVAARALTFFMCHFLVGGWELGIWGLGEGSPLSAAT